MSRKYVIQIFTNGKWRGYKNGKKFDNTAKASRTLWHLRETETRPTRIIVFVKKPSRAV